MIVRRGKALADANGLSDANANANALPLHITIMKYDPQKHHRRSIRLKGYDYTQQGAYFITLCAHQRECLFGDIANGEMQTNQIGEIVITCWTQLATHFRNIELDAFVIMPNHIHGIVVIVHNPARIADDARRGKALADAAGLSDADANANALPLQNTPHGTQPRSLNAIVQNFKSITARHIHKIPTHADRPIWQRNYYEHIIRNDAALERIRVYIENNPMNWQTDENYHV